MSHNRPWGSAWRILAKGEGDDVFSAEDRGVFDELVIDQWFHLEQMSDNTWWVRVGDARIDIEIQSDGKAKVLIERGVYEE